MWNADQLRQETIKVAGLYFTLICMNIVLSKRNRTVIIMEDIACSNEQSIK